MRTLYINGSITTMDSGRPETDAVLVDRGRIAAVGPEAHRGGDGARVIDLGGARVVPGMIDAHTHLETAALARLEWLDVRETERDEVLRRIADRVAAVGPGEWIVAQGTFGQDLPDRYAVDRVAPANPVLIRRSMHALTANTAAIDRTDLRSRPNSPTGSIIYRDRGGEPTGHMLEAFHLFPVPVPEERRLAGLIADEISERFHRFGVTAINEVPFSRTGIRALQLLHDEGRLEARVSINPAVRPGLQPILEDISEWAGIGLKSGFGDDRLWLGAAKYFLDGDEEASFEVARNSGSPAAWGAPTHLSNDLVRALVIGYRSGIQLWIHALGPDAQRQAMDAVEAAQHIVGGTNGLRMRIEHVGNQPVPDGMLQRMVAASVIPVPTAAFMHFYETSGRFAYRSMIDAGLTPPGNSDNAGTQPFATNPWFGIRKMLVRDNKRGEIIAPAERIGLHEALRVYTEFGVAAASRRMPIGMIAAGGHADFAVLSEDPFALGEDELDRVESVLTVVAGAHVWDRR